MSKSARVSTVEARIRERSNADSQAKKKVTGARIIYRYGTSSCRKSGNADSWLVLFVIDCKFLAQTAKTLVAPEKTNFLARSVQFPLSNPAKYL